MFKRKINIDCHGSRLIPNIAQHLDPPYFSFPITFKFITKYYAIQFMLFFFVLVGYL
jgi:hypothetical protein